MSALPATTEAPPGLPFLLAQLDDTLADARLSDDDKRALIAFLKTF